MYLEYLCHACIRCVADNGKKLILDPPAPDYGYLLPDRDADYVTASHGHRDHCALELFAPEAQLPQEGLSLHAGPFTIEAYDCWHDDAQGTKRGSNRVHKITADGTTVVHLGDLGHMPDEALAAFAKNADLLVVPVGGVFMLEPEQMLEVIRLLQPKFVLPVHYRTAQTTLQQLRPLEDFLSLWSGPVLQPGGCTFDPAASAAETTAVILDFTSRKG